MLAVLDLVETGFGNELDPPGWKALRQMRSMVQPNALARTFLGTITDTEGFVCEMDGAIVGNLSLRNAYPRSSRGLLVGNVVVHPGYRRQGIGKALMECALQAARQKQAAWIGLEVRADNTDACQMYRHLGFQSTGTTEHMLRPKERDWPSFATPDHAWRRFHSEDNDRWHQLAARIHGQDQQLILEIRRDLHNFRGFERWLDRVLSRQAEDAWVHPSAGDEIDLAVHTDTDRKYRFHVWDVLVQPDLGAGGAYEGVAQCIAATRRFPAWPVVAIVADQRTLVEQLRAIGFHSHRTLEQMIVWF
jgi:GNAT superfamily N-acetyltransferase